MGIFSKHHRYRNPGEQANVLNVEEFGYPAKSLFTTSKVFTLHHKIDITDDGGNVLYQSTTKVPSIRDKTDVTNALGHQVAHIERKIFSLRNRHFVTMADGTQFQVACELLHLVKDIINIEELGWQIRGNILALNFQLYDRDGSVIAVISQKMVSLHDKYCIDIYKPEYENIVIAILVTLQHIIRDRENASASSSSSSSS